MSDRYGRRPMLLVSIIGTAITIVGFIITIQQQFKIKSVSTQIKKDIENNSYF